MIIWNGKEYARIGGPLVIVEEPMFMRLDDWRLKFQKYMNFERPADLDQKPQEDRFAWYAEKDRLFKDHSMYWMAHLEKHLHTK